MFAKTSLSTAVAAAFGVAAVGTASADTVFFPYTPVSATVASVVSVINTSNNTWTSGGLPLAGGNNLHYRYYYKAAGQADERAEAKAECVEYDEFLPTSVNDLQTVDLSGRFAVDTAGVLFADPSINNKWKQSGRDYAFGRSVIPSRAYLTVDNSDPNDGAWTIGGDAFIFEFGSGAAYGYEGLSNDGLIADYRWAASRSPAAVSLMPFDEIETVFFVTPVDFDQTPSSTNDYLARVELVTSGRAGDLYDRDENLISGTIPYDVVCVGRVPAKDLLSDAARARLIKGGWGNLWSYRLTRNADGDLVAAAFNAQGSLAPAANANRANASDGAVVIKLEYNNGGTFNGEAVGGTYNNAIMIQPDPNNPL